VPFFSISGSDFVEMFVGVGASRVRDLFKQARENSPCIIFLDEIDAVGRRRGSGMGGGHDEREQTLNAILVEMDGFDTDEGIIVIAATNRPDVLDPALLRPGRFDREVTIDLPDVQGREEILKVHLKKVKHDDRRRSATLARSTPGYSGADLAAIINEAAIRRRCNKSEAIEHGGPRGGARQGALRPPEEVAQAIEEEDARSPPTTRPATPSSRRRSPRPTRRTRSPSCPAAARSARRWSCPRRRATTCSASAWSGSSRCSSAARVSEALFCGDISAGASDDIRRATELARAMVTELGMSERIGPINYAERQGSDFLGTELLSGKWHSEVTAREIDEEVRQLFTDAYAARRADRARTNRDQIEILTSALLKYETITGEEIVRILRGASIADLRPAAPADEAKPAADSGARRRSPAAREGEIQGELPGEPGLSPA
jgi:cell division protease FtsH